MNNEVPFQIITLELKELDGKYEGARPTNIIKDAINILLIDDLFPGTEDGDYKDLWEKFISNNVFDTIGQRLNLFWIRSVHAACLKLIDNHQEILPEASFTPDNTIIFLDMEFQHTREEGWQIPSKPKFKEYLKGKGVEFDNNPGVRNGGGILHGGTEGGEILLKTLDKAKENAFLIFPWTSDPSKANADDRYEPFRNRFHRLLVPLSKGIIWAAGRDNCKHLKRALELLKNPLAELDLSKVSRKDLSDAYSKLFTGDLPHPPSQILTFTNINKWNDKFYELLNTSVEIAGKKGRWSQIDDKELQRIFTKIKEELKKDKVSKELQLCMLKLRSMFLRRENKKVSLMDLFENLISDSIDINNRYINYDKVELNFNYYNQLFSKHLIKSELTNVGFSISLWKEIADHDNDIAVIEKEFNFYDLKDAISKKISESSSLKGTTNVQVDFFYDASSIDASECLIVIKDNAGNHYNKEFSESSRRGQEFEFLKFVKEKLGVNSINVLTIRDVLSKPPKDYERLANQVKNCLSDQSYILTVEDVYTEIVLKII